MKHWILFTVILSVFCVADVISEDAAAATPGDRMITGMFNCLRPGMNCEGDVNATMCSDDGECVCEAGLEGFDCSVNSTDVLSDDQCVCENDGQCVRDDADSPSCFCADSAFFGAACENSRVEQTCNVDSMEIKITPFNNVNGFIGLIYVKTQASDSACVFAEGEPGTLQLTLNFEQCGGAENSTTAEGDVVQTFKIIVQYDDLFVTDTDQEFTVNCIIKATDSLVNNDDGAQIATNEEDTPLQQQEVTQEVLPVDVELLQAEDLSPIDGPVRIGTLLTLRLTLNGGDVYDSFRCEFVQAHNGLQTEQLDFVNEACVTEVAGRRGKKIVKDFTGDVTSQISLTFKLFKFKFTSQLAFRITVKLCKGTGGCNATDCPDSGFMGLGRKKRGIEDDLDIHTPRDLSPDSHDKFERLSAGVLVLLPGEEEEEETNPTQGVVQSTAPRGHYVTAEPGLCLQNIWIVTCILLTALVCVIAGALIGWLCVRRKLSKSKDTGAGYTNPAYNTKF